MSTNHKTQTLKKRIASLGAKYENLEGALSGSLQYIYRQSLVKLPPIKNTSRNDTLHIFHHFSRYP